MKNKIILVLIFFVTFYGYSQHTKRFLELTKDLVPFKQTVTLLKNKNNTIKTKFKFNTYKFENEKFICEYGNRKVYNYKGEIEEDIEHDNFGNIITQKFYDKNGRVIKEINAKRIDLISDTNKEEHLNIKLITTKSLQEEYKFSKKLNKMYLFKKGYLKDKEKKGVWTTYNEKGEVRKEKVY